MNDITIAFEVITKIFSGMFLHPEGIAVLIFFGAFAGVMALKIKFEQ